MLRRRVRPGMLLLEDVDLVAIVIGGKPDHGHRGETFGLRDLAHAEHLAVERASISIPARGHGDAGVLQSLDRRHDGLLSWAWARFAYFRIVAQSCRVVAPWRHLP